MEMTSSTVIALIKFIDIISITLSQRVWDFGGLVVLAFYSFDANRAQYIMTVLLGYIHKLIIILVSHTSTLKTWIISAAGSYSCNNLHPGIISSGISVTCQINSK